MGGRESARPHLGCLLPPDPEGRGRGTCALTLPGAAASSEASAPHASRGQQLAAVHQLVQPGLSPRATPHACPEPLPGAPFGTVSCPPPQPSLICLHPHWKSPSTTPAASEPTGGGRSSQLWVWLLLVPPRGSPRLCPAVSGSPHTAVSLRLGLVGTAIFKTMLQWASLIRLEFILVWVSFEVGTCAFHTGFSSLASEHLVSSFA